MSKKGLLVGLAVGLLLGLQGWAVAAVPQDVPKDVKYILGFYYGNGENILIRENKGNLELLYRFSRQDKCFDKANIFPLSKNHFDSYTLNESGPLHNTEVVTGFERDKDGYGVTCKVGGHRYSRYFLGQGSGERAEAFRFPKNESFEQLRKDAQAAVMPVALQNGTAAKLVNLNTIAGIKIDSRYAGVNNCFGAPLYENSNLFLAAEAAKALAEVNKELQHYGYALVIWDAYRPWYISKLAYLALPADKKYMLENPDEKGSKHNSGMAVDASLYELSTGNQVEMISDFDEPSIRQYTSYPGGTERQRYLRDLLHTAMEKQGFKGIEMEWWHFEYQNIDNYAHLNIPISEIK